MKALFSSLLVCLSFVFVPVEVVAPKAKTSQDSKTYVPISKEKFKEIETAMHLQDDWIPILLEGFTKSELVSFYIESYGESTVKTWGNWACGKLRKSTSAKPTADQEQKFQKILALPQTKDTMYDLMMLMTTKQIELIGY